VPCPIRWASEPPPAATAANKEKMKQFVIIGNSAAGISAIEAIRSRDKQSKITVISDENYPAYCRCLISYYLASTVKEDKIFYRAENFYKENNVGLILNKKVSRVDPKKNRVICEDKSQLNYDALLIATGARPKFPEIKGIKKKGVFGFRTLKDAKDIEALLPVTKSACVLGAGLVGLKAAYGLKKRNIHVKVIAKSGQILSQMLDPQAAKFVQKRIEDNGIEIILGQDVSEVIGDPETMAIKLDSGKALECTLLIVGKGVTPNIDLVKEGEVKTGMGIISNKLLETSVPNIYCAGDVCESFDLAAGKLAVNALWPMAVEQGRTAGLNMAGAGINYEGSVGMNAIEFFGLPVVSLGEYKMSSDCSGCEELKILDEKAGVYKKIVLKDNIIVGAIFTQDIKASGVFLRLIREKVNVSIFKDKLLSDNFGYPDIMDYVKESENCYV
jgi:NAD(P)H-nitrite reductase large subunit